MTSFGGAGIPKAILNANTVLEKLRKWRDTARLKPETKLLVEETELAIVGLKEHADAEFKRGKRIGKDVVLNHIRNKFDPDFEEAE